MKKRLQWFILFLIVGIIYVTPVFAVDNYAETSVVSLIVKSNQEVIGKDDYFELIDCGDYQLVPLNSLATRLEFELGFDRTQNVVTVFSVRFNRKVQVHIDKQQYLVEGKSEWGTEPPVALDGIFYVSTLLIEYVAQVKINWAAKYQELTIEGDWLSPKTAHESKLNPKNGTDQDQADGEKPLEGPSVSLGTIEYELSWEKRRDSSGNETGMQTLGVRSDGRAGPWTLTLGGQFGYNTINQNMDTTLSLIRAKYNENNQWIVLGDSEVILDETLGTKELRGFLWMTPNQLQSNESIEYTTVSGIAEPGDKVKLLVNGQIISELTVSQGNSYVFMNVPLQLRRINVIKTLITKANGETLETCKKVAAYPRCLKSGDFDYLVASGSYRQAAADLWQNELRNETPGNNVSLTPWEGNVTALKADYGITDRFTLHSEIAHIRPFNANGQETGSIAGADLGVAFRLGEGLVFTLDWLAGGGADHNIIESGWNSSFLYELENGNFEAIAFNVPNEASKGLCNTIAGIGVQLFGELEFNKDTTFKVYGNRVESNAAPGSSWSEINAKLDQHRGIETLIDNSVSVVVKNSSTLSQVQNQTALALEHLKRGQGFSYKETLGLSNLGFPNNSGLTNVQSISWEESFLKSIRDSLIGCSINSAGNWWDGMYHDLTLIAEADFKWNHKNTWIAMRGSVTGNHEAGTDVGLSMDAFEFSGSAQYYFTRSTHGYLKWDRMVDNLNNNAYTTGTVGFFHRWPKNSGSLWADVGYSSPLGGIGEPQWSPSLGVSKIFPSGFEIVLEMERDYQSLWSDSYELVYRLSFRQALGFSNGQVHTLPYATAENLSLIGGIVYLDENGNRRRDPGEKGLANVRIKLDGSVVETNTEGKYLIRSVEPGIYRVNFDFKSLPADYTPVTGEQLVKLKQSETLFLDFGVTMNGSISGKVFTDKNANGRWDPGEQPLTWVGILLDGAKKYFTLQDGSFYIENVPLGTHTISIIPETVPKGMEVKQAEEYPVHITEKSLDVMDVLFPVVFKFTE